jgi:hypothetical protein
MSRTTSNSSLISFRAAVSLNNMGVCTMEHGHFAAALETLKDSLYVMKNIILPGAGDDASEQSGRSFNFYYSQHQQQQQQEEENMLQAARRRLAIAQAQPFDMNDFIDIQTCDDGNVTAMKIPMMQEKVNNKDDDVGSPPVFIPIRLESCSNADFDRNDHDRHQQQVQDQIERMFRIPSAFILYNYGLTHILAHLQDKKSDVSTIAAAVSGITTTAPRFTSATESISHESSSQSLLQGGIVCFTCAHGILCQARGGAAASVGDGGAHNERHQHHHAVSFEILQAMLLSGLVLRNLFCLFLLNHQVQTAQNVLNSLSSLLYMIQVHEHVLRNMNVALENRQTACAA